MSPRRIDPKTKTQSSGLPTWVIAVGIGVVVVLAAVGLFLIQTPAAPAPTTGGSITASGRTIGNSNSKVAFVEFSDFQ